MILHYYRTEIDILWCDIFAYAGSHPQPDRQEQDEVLEALQRRVCGMPSPPRQSLLPVEGDSSQPSPL